MIRCYESLISTLYKYPWFAHEDVLIFERGKLFEATISTIKALIALLRRVNGGKQKADIHNPTISTLIELATAVFVCPGFTDKQKALLANTLHASGHGKLADDRSLNLRFGGIDKYGKDMPFHVLVKQPGVPHDLVDVRSPHPTYPS